MNYQQKGQKITGNAALIACNLRANRKPQKDKSL